MRKTLLLLLALGLLALCACGDLAPRSLPAPEETEAPQASLAPDPTPRSVQPAAAPREAAMLSSDLDDRPANREAPPENRWVEVNYERDGVPFDPEAPARDGHTHDWNVDKSRSWGSTCGYEGQYMQVCSICGREWCVHVPQLEHQFHEMRYSNDNWVYDVCSLCGLRVAKYLIQPSGGGYGSLLDPVPTPWTGGVPVIIWDP